MRRKSKRSRTAGTSTGWTSTATSRRPTFTQPSRCEAATSTSTTRAVRRSDPTPRSTTRTTARTRHLDVPFKCALAPETPNNEGLFRPIHVSAPEGSILNATFPAPVKARAKTTNNINQVIFGALWHGVRRAGAGERRWHLAARADGRRRRVRAFPGRHASSRWARRDADTGRDGSGLVPGEQHDHPVRGDRDPGPHPVPQEGVLGRQRGHGRHRGGVGQVIVFEHVGGDTIVFNLTPDRITTKPQGLGGGGPGRSGVALLNGRELDGVSADPAAARRRRGTPPGRRRRVRSRRGASARCDRRATSSSAT